MPELLQSAEFWVAVAFILFILLLLDLGVPKMVTKQLDDRAERIRKELDEARKLREQAQALLDDYIKKRSHADAEAASIIDTARREAEAMAFQSQAALAEMVERRSKQAAEKIARAEAQAVADVRAAVVDKAIAASRTMMAGRASGPAAAGLIEQSIRELKGKLN